MITMAETASAVCLTEGCFWTASGPQSAEAAISHDWYESYKHNIHLTSGLLAAVPVPLEVSEPKSNIGDELNFEGDYLHHD